MYSSFLGLHLSFYHFEFSIIHLFCYCWDNVVAVTVATNTLHKYLILLLPLMLTSVVCMRSRASIASYCVIVWTDSVSFPRQFMYICNIVRCVMYNIVFKAFDYAARSLSSLSSLSFVAVVVVVDSWILILFGWRRPMAHGVTMLLVIHSFWCISILFNVFVTLFNSRFSLSSSRSRLQCCWSLEIRVAWSYGCNEFQMDQNNGWNKVNATPWEILLSRNPIQRFTYTVWKRERERENCTRRKMNWLFSINGATWQL